MKMMMWTERERIGGGRIGAKTIMNSFVNFVLKFIASNIFPSSGTQTPQKHSIVSRQPDVTSVDVISSDVTSVPRRQLLTAGSQTVLVSCHLVLLVFLTIVDHDSRRHHSIPRHNQASKDIADINTDNIMSKLPASTIPERPIQMKIQQQRRSLPTRRLRKFQFHPDSRFICSIVCMSMSAFRSILPTVSSLIITPRNLRMSYHRRTNAVTNAFFSSRLLPITGTKLDTNANDDDAAAFASFNNLDQGEDDDGRRLAREFYQELHIRQSRSPLTLSTDGNTFEGNSRNDLRQADKSSRASRNHPTTSPSSQEPSSSPLLSFLSFFSPAPRPSPSAGLFTGSGTTVYSSGRSIRAEMEILETTIKRNDDQQSTNNMLAGLLSGIQQKQPGGSAAAPQQSDEVFRIAVALLLVLSTAYIVISIGGMAEVVTLNGASSSASHVLSLMNDATKSSVVISVGQGDMFMEEEAAMLLRQSSEWAVLAAESVVRSLEELVLR